MADNLVGLYFKLGLNYGEILAILAFKHDTIVSMRTLKRILKRLALYRRKNFSDVYEVAAFIEEQLGKSGRLHGYRWMHTKCIQHGYVIPKEHVRALLGILDPSGVEDRLRRRLRRRQYFAKGPNFVWHLDGYDKLKPYGIAIHGCIDGFSRKILWLEANRTNNDPLVIAGYFTATVV